MNIPMPNINVQTDEGRQTVDYLRQVVTELNYQLSALEHEIEQLRRASNG